MGLHFILDPSALVYGGIGKLKKWYSVYSDCEVKVTFHVPYYTLKELDFLKKVYNPLISSNARESIRFIDECISTGLDTIPGFSDDDDDDDDDDDYDDDGLVDCDDGIVDFESYNRSKSNNSTQRKHSHKNQVTFQLEGESEMGPHWRITSGYRNSTPLIKDLPNYDENGKVGVYGMKMAGGFSIDPSSKSSSMIYDPFAELERSENENENNTDDDDDEDEVETYGDSKENIDSQEEQKAKVPQNLKKLIRYVVQKHYIDNRSLPIEERVNWFVITEEAITKIWLKSFGLNVIDLTIAERLINGSLTVNQVLTHSSQNGEEDSQIQVREFYNPKTHKLDYLGRSKVQQVSILNDESVLIDEHPMLFDPVSGEMVRADKFKGIKSTFRRSRGTSSWGNKHNRSSRDKKKVTNK